MQVNGWELFAHPLLQDQLDKLITAVEKERAKKPTTYRGSANFKVLAALRQLLLITIPADPTRPEYRQGGTLGGDRKHWFRAKFGGQRFRLFFRYDSKAKIIIYAWVNDSDTVLSANCQDVQWTQCVVNIPDESASVPEFRSKSGLAVHPTRPGWVYYVDSGAGFIYRNISGCTNTADPWAPEGGALPNGNVPYSIYVDTSSDLLVGTANGVWEFTGTAWENLGLPGYTVVSVTSSPQFAPPATGTLFAATTKGLFVKPPGQPWEIGAPGDEPFADVAVDPKCPSHIFAAAGYAGTFEQTGGGVWFSSNTGTGGSWRQIATGTGVDLFISPIASLTVDPTFCSGASCDVVWAATYGLGTWSYATDSQTCP